MKLVTDQKLLETFAVEKYEAYKGLVMCNSSKTFFGECASKARAQVSRHLPKHSFLYVVLNCFFSIF
jgi:hypothetical protein